MPDKTAIVRELIEYNERPHIEDDEFLLKEYREGWEEVYGEPIPEQTARGQLKSMEEEGLVTSREVFVNGYYYIAYRRVGNE